MQDENHTAERYEKISICEKDDNNQVFKKNKKASKLVINEKELFTLKLIFRKFQELKSLTKLETYLMNNNIKTRKGTYYTLFALRWILTNPVYVQNDEKALEYFKEKKIHVYAEEDNRNKFDGSYGFLTYHKTSGNKNLPKEE